MMKLNKNSKKLLGMVAVALVVLYLLNYRLVTPANNSGGDVSRLISGLFTGP